MEKVLKGKKSNQQKKKEGKKQKNGNGKEQKWKGIKNKGSATEYNGNKDGVKRKGKSK